jgi:hypothetical protein
LKSLRSQILMPRPLTSSNFSQGRLAATSMLLGAGLLLLSGCNSPRRAALAGSPVSDGQATNSSQVFGSSPALVVSVNEKREIVKVNSVLVAPVTFDAGARTLSGDWQRLSAALFDSMRQELDLQLTSWTEVSAKGTGAANDGRKPASTARVGTLTSEIVGSELPRATLLAAAKKQGAGAVLFTTLHEYRERRGSAVGASELARTYFTVSLVSVTSEKPIWEASYRFKDQAASENLLALKDRLFKSNEGIPTSGGVGFRDGEELLLSGFRASARELASARMRSFSVDGIEKKAS